MAVLSRCKPLLGTFVEVSLEADCSDHKLFELSELAFSEIERVQRALSFHDRDSELSEFNRWGLSAAVEPFTLSEDLAAVLGLAQELYVLTAGRYDIAVAPALVAQGLLPDHLLLDGRMPQSMAALSIDGQSALVSAPMCIDLGGIAKGYAVDRAFELIPADVHVVINAGGDMRMSHWQGQSVGLQFARPSWARRAVPVTAPAIASSGHYYRRAIIDPVAGKPVKRGGAVSVFAESSMVADALTKVVWLLPENKAKDVLRRYNARAITVSRFGQLKQVS